jgi:translation initiation factor eIF-2B subunit beta
MSYYYILELAVGNIVRRVLKIIREVARGELNNSNANNHTNELSEEYSSDEEELEDKSNIKIQVNSELSLQPQSSMFNLLSDAPTAKFEDAKVKNTYNLKPLIIQEINEEIIADLESVYKGIADQATDFIHAK